MKRLIIGVVLLFIAMTALYSFAWGEDQDLRNTGFEESDGGGLAGWEFYGPEGALFLDGRVYYEGGRSARISSAKYPDEEIRLQQTVSVEAGRRYDVGGVVRTEFAKEGYAQIKVVFLDKNKARIKEVELPRISGARNWSSTQIWLKSPNGADAASVICLVKGGGDAWFDDMHFTTKLIWGY